MSNGEKIAVVMGSDSGFAVVSAAIKRFKAYEVPAEVCVMPAHRMPPTATESAKNVRVNGFDVIIAAASKTVHLAGVLAAYITLSITGIPTERSTLGDPDVLLATVQTPSDVPAVTVAIDGVDGAALLTIQTSPLTDETLADQLGQIEQKMADEAKKKDEAIQLAVKALQVSNGGKGMKGLSGSYKAAGVDVTAGYRAVGLMKSHVTRTTTPGVLFGLGDLGSLLRSDLSGMKEPVLVSGISGVGTKLRLALLMDQHDTIGIDRVAMCANDMVCGGTQLLFFLDYPTVDKNHLEKTEKIVAGVAEGCAQSNYAPADGETAETSGLYPEGEYGLVGFCMIMVDRLKIINGPQTQPGDVILGLGSSGVYSNSFSLVRKVFRLGSGNVGRHVDELGKTLGKELLTPTRIYIKSVLNLMKQYNVKVAPHITGGGFYESMSRTMKEDLTARLEEAVLPSLPAFHLLQPVDNIPGHDMYNTFNMGISMCLVVSLEETGRATALLREVGERVFVISQAEQGTEGVTLC